MISMRYTAAYRCAQSLTSSLNVFSNLAVKQHLYTWLYILHNSKEQDLDSSLIYYIHHFFAPSHFEYHFRSFLMCVYIYIYISVK